MADKNCILVILKNKFEEDIFYNYTYPTFKAYSDKIDTELKVILISEIIEINRQYPQFELFTLLNEYKRIIYLEPNMIIREDTPNLFEKVPVPELGLFNESQYVSRIKEMYEAINWYEEQEVQWKGMYYSTSVMVVSRIHKQLFKNPKNLELSKLSFTQFLNYKLMMRPKDYKIYNFDWRYNRTALQDKKVGITRLASYIINYEGAPQDMLLNVLTKDLADWKQASPDFNFKRNIVISVVAGMGDQLCSEPAIRYMMKHIFPDDNYTIVTHFPRLFQHLNVPIFHHEDWKGQSFDSLVVHSCPDDEVSEHHMSHVMFHPTDFASMSMFKMTMPNIDKTIKLDIRIDDFADLIEIVGGEVNLSDLVLVHPGRWWPSKTFPSWWWEKVIIGLRDAGLPVGIIGKYSDEKQGCLEFDCPDGVIDFRDKTSLSAYIALISQAKVVVTNDSSPIHIAGAFENWIFTVPTCKYADSILPYRHQTQIYKTHWLNKKYTIDDLNVNWLKPDVDTIDNIAKGHTIEEYLPEPEDVIRDVVKIYKNAECKTFEEILEKEKNCNPPLIQLKEETDVE